MSTTPHATDVIPNFAEITERMEACPEWARVRATAIVYPDCPPPGVLYVMPAPRKVFLVLTIAEALTEAAARADKKIAEAVEILRVADGDPAVRDGIERLQRD